MEEHFFAIVLLNWVMPASALVSSFRSAMNLSAPAVSRLAKEGEMSRKLIYALALWLSPLSVSADSLTIQSVNMTPIIRVAQDDSWKEQFCPRGIVEVEACVFQQKGCDAGTIEGCWEVCGLEHYLKGGDQC
ncbi:hypothetical protein NKH70_25250 [Mesorhizobium sp. M0991]|uniref:hypothetical protein n=1 Tax=Mesorhizobium sp. M0991 TaxID=2957043 RepID=UPI00333AE484